MSIRKNSAIGRVAFYGVTAGIFQKPNQVSSHLSFAYTHLVVTRLNAIEGDRTISALSAD